MDPVVELGASETLLPVVETVAPLDAEVDADAEDVEHKAMPLNLPRNSARNG